MRKWRHWRRKWWVWFMEYWKALIPPAILNRAGSHFMSSTGVLWMQLDDIQPGAEMPLCGFLPIFFAYASVCSKEQPTCMASSQRALGRQGVGQCDVNAKNGCLPRGQCAADCSWEVEGPTRDVCAPPAPPEIRSLLMPKVMRAAMHLVLVCGG